VLEVGEIIPDPIGLRAYRLLSCQSEDETRTLMLCHTRDGWTAENHLLPVRVPQMYKQRGGF
jgi:hypothetical protein